MARTEPLPLFYSLNRFIDHEACISAGSVEICRASFIVDVVGKGVSSAVKLTVEGKLDTCGSVLFPTLLSCRMLKTAGSMVLRRLFFQA
jgi:hypothetical protein